MGPNGFMGTTLFAHCKFKVLLKNVYIYKLFATMHSKKRKTVSVVFTAHNFTSVGHIGDSTVKERSHIANAHLKIIR